MACAAIGDSFHEHCKPYSVVIPFFLGIFSRHRTWNGLSAILGLRSDERGKPLFHRRLTRRGTDLLLATPAPASPDCQPQAVGLVYRICIGWSMYSALLLQVSTPAVAHADNHIRAGQSEFGSQLRVA